jgi:hypothetical protein
VSPTGKSCRIVEAARLFFLALLEIQSPKKKGRPVRPALQIKRLGLGAWESPAERATPARPIGYGVDDVKHTSVVRLEAVEPVSVSAGLVSSPTTVALIVLWCTNPVVQEVPVTVPRAAQNWPSK